MSACRSAAPSHGAASLTIILLLIFAAALTAGATTRSLLVEQRAQRQQLQAALAQEAAEAGIEWALGRLNSAAPLAPDCSPASVAEGASFGERMLSYDSAGGRHTVRLRPPDGAACQILPGPWRCNCSGSALPEPGPDDHAPVFRIEFTALPEGGVQLRSTGCAQGGAPCTPGPRGAAAAAVQLSLVRAGGLRARPAAALTAGGDVRVSGAVGFHNPDALSSGVAVHAGGRIDAPTARIGTVAGGVAAQAAVEADAALAVLGARLFARHFGADSTGWARQPAVHALTCRGRCSEALASASHHARLLYADGDLELEGPLSLGSAERPLILVATGRVRLLGGVQMHGLIYARDLVWDDTGATPAWLRGGALVQAATTGNGAPDYLHDPAVLARLQRDAGSWVRVPGSWRDVPPVGP